MRLRRLVSRLRASTAEAIVVRTHGRGRITPTERSTRRELDVILPS